MKHLMPNPRCAAPALSLSTLLLVLIASGCSEDSGKAHAGSPSGKNPQAGDAVFPRASPVGRDSSWGLGAGSDGGRPELSGVKVEVLEVANWTGESFQRPESAGKSFVGVRVRVTNFRKDLRIKLAYDRFRLVQGSKSVAPNSRSPVEPSLEYGHLPEGQGREGWLAFEFSGPMESASLAANFANPPITIPLK